MEKFLFLLFVRVIVDWHLQGLNILTCTYCFKIPGMEYTFQFSYNFEMNNNGCDKQMSPYDSEKNIVKKSLNPILDEYIHNETNLVL